jgi:hypothetical protein
MTILDTLTQHYGRLAALPLTVELLFGIDAADQCEHALKTFTTVAALQKIEAILAPFDTEATSPVIREYIDDVRKLREITENPVAHIQRVTTS